MKHQQLQTLIQDLKKSSLENKVNLWKRIALDLEGSSAKRVAVNLSKIDKYTKTNDVVVVPGKVLSMGTLSKKITIAAYRFSSQAIEKINAAGAKAITIEELVKSNPKASKVRIIG